MIVVDRTLFEKRYRQLMEVTIQKSGAYDTTEIAFDKGFWKEEEWYKKEIWARAQTVIDVSTWTLSRPDGISKTIEKLFWLTAEDGIVQNLVSLPNIEKALPCIRKDRTAINSIYSLYTGQGDPRGIFDNLKSSFLKAKVPDPYSVVAYLFFLKDKDKYIPIRKKSYSVECLPKLGIPSELAQKCTWENYITIIEATKQIQEYLLEHLENVDLLDAQSFLWMMHFVDGNTKEYDPDDIGYNESKVTYNAGFGEGRKTEYYVTKYERNVQNRKEAIKIHGCRCAACGFDFAEFYGKSLGKGFIEVHHIVPLSTLNEEVIVDPATDLICLCANCHRMIHRKKNKVLTLEELKAQIAQNSADKG